MGVALKSQAEMTTVEGRVNGLLHGAQQHGVNLLGVGPVFGGLGNGLEFTRCRVVADGHAQARGAQVVGQQIAFFGRGAFMHPEHAGVLALQNEVGAAHIGNQHGLFNQTVGLVAHAGHDFFDAPTVVADDLGFGGLEVNRTARLARLQQNTVDLMQVQQMGHQVFAACGFGASGVGQNGRHFGVGEAGVTEHHRRVKLVGVDLALSVDQHVGHHAQALHFGVQGAQAIGEFFGQHGDHPARKIHAGGPVIGIDVNVRAGAHIMAHIGNRHQQTPPLAPPDLGGFAINGVVKIAGVFAVNGDQGHIGQVDSALFVLRSDFVRQGLGLAQAGL